MNGHFNRAARRSGGDKAFVLPVPSGELNEGDVVLWSHLIDLDRTARKYGIPLIDLINKAREEGYIDCTDEEAKELPKLLI